MRIVIEDVTVGTLTEEGKIVSENPFLKALAQNCIELQAIEHDDAVGRVRTVTVGQDGYLPAVVDVLEEEGYGVVADVSST
ncbi:hypothetical protein ACFLXE_00345 [Chloroflexota bacterium]